MRTKNKFYVVWEGEKTGIFSSWEECDKQVNGYSNSKYKGFRTREEADYAFQLGYSEFLEYQRELEEAHNFSDFF